MTDPARPSTAGVPVRVEKPPRPPRRRDGIALATTVQLVDRVRPYVLEEHYTELAAWSRWARIGRVRGPSKCPLVRRFNLLAPLQPPAPDQPQHTTRSRSPTGPVAHRGPSSDSRSLNEMTELSDLTRANRDSGRVRDRPDRAVGPPGP